MFGNWSTIGRRLSWWSLRPILWTGIDFESNAVVHLPMGRACVQLSAPSSTPDKATIFGFRQVSKPVQSIRRIPNWNCSGEPPSTARRAKLGGARRRGPRCTGRKIFFQIVVTGTVDMNSTGTYLLTYTVQDGAGNTATATRTVTVVGNRTVDLNATVAMDMIWCPPWYFYDG